MKQSKGNEIEGNDQWIAVYTKPKQEHIAVENITRLGYEVYCPMIKRRISHARKVQMALRPLFPSYIFVRIEKRKPQWRPIMSSKGVTSIIRFGDKLGLLPQALIDYLRVHETGGSLRQMSAPQFKIGEEVCVTDGPLKDFMAKVLSASDNERIWLLLELMGRSIRVHHDALSITRRI